MLNGKSADSGSTDSGDFEPPVVIAKSAASRTCSPSKAIMTA
jgi:hypothetical protein